MVCLGGYYRAAIGLLYMISLRVDAQVQTTRSGGGWLCGPQGTQATKAQGAGSSYGPGEITRSVVRRIGAPAGSRRLTLKILAETAGCVTPFVAGEFGVDEDDETALFVVETVAAAKILVEAGANVNHKGSEGFTAREKILAEGDFPIVAEYLSRIEVKQANDTASTAAAVLPEAIPPPPEGMKVTVGTMDESQDIPEDVDPEFRRRIEELAGRDDFNTPQGQAELRKLVEDAILGEGIGDERNVRSKQG
ncbi:hypothetical protein CEP52_016122 [Fusarium oligoseptatum]|uniref:Ankyrin repeat protein n=1 Tax=Fusarium oligoseptatum TaxID=2604345 RepID=A0A428S6I5_9HYPO|nr:hypothetical protein CEP52_016122 [Fusarium oligoseptatum]